MTKSAFLHSSIFNQKAWPLHVYFSTLDITMFTWGSDKLGICVGIGKITDSLLYYKLWFLLFKHYAYVQTAH